MRLSQAGRELDKVTGNIVKLKADIARLREGEYRELQERKDRLEEKKKDKKIQQSQNQNLTNERTRMMSQKEGEANRLRAELEEKQTGYRACLLYTSDAADD